MDSQRFFKLFLIFMLILATLNLIEGRGGGRRGGGLFSWRKVKKPSFSITSSRRQNSGSQVSGSLGTNIAYKPIKPITQSKPQTPSYPRQQLPTGTTYYGRGSSLPQGATYHSDSYYSSGVSNRGAIPSGGVFYANTAALPTNAVLYAQPSKSAFNPGNFLFGMYAGHMLGQGLFGHHPRGMHVHRANNDQQQDNKDQIVIINNGPAETVAESPNETLKSTFVLESSTEEQNYTIVKDTAAMEQTEYGIICFPFIVNETSERDDQNMSQVEKIVCYPAPPPAPSIPATVIPQSEASSGIICVLRKDIETNLTDSFQTKVTSEQDCYPAPPEESHSTKSPESVIGNIPNDEEMITEQDEALGTGHQTQTVLKALQEEEEKEMADFVKQFQHETFKLGLHVADSENFRISASQCYMLQPLYAILIPFTVLLCL